MRAVSVLAKVARRLNREAGAPAIAALYFFTDPERTPDPLAVAARLPPGAAVVYRHFGAADRETVAQRLAKLCRARRLVLLIAADPDLARKVGAGIHWPERLVPSRRRGPGLQTAAAHGPAGLLRAARAGMDACVLGPIFPTRSPSGRAPLGLPRASALARAAGLPIVALGGVNPHTAKRLLGRGFAGLAAVEALTL